MRLLSAAVLLLGFAACTEFTDPPVDVWTVVAVRGSVSTASGAAVPGASVLLSAFRGACGTGVPDGATEASTDGSGKYLATMQSSRTEGLRCIRADATMTPLTGSKTLFGVTFQVDTPPRDTVTIDVVIQ